MKNAKRKMQGNNLKLKIKKKVLNFELWFFVFHFKFLVLQCVGNAYSLQHSKTIFITLSPILLLVSKLLYL